MVQGTGGYTHHIHTMREGKVIHAGLDACADDACTLLALHAQLSCIRSIITLAKCSWSTHALTPRICTTRTARAGPGDVDAPQRRRDGGDRHARLHQARAAPHGPQWL